MFKSLLIVAAVGLGTSVLVSPAVAASAAPAPTTVPKLVDVHTCDDDAAYICAVLPVPLDRTGAVKGTLRLAVEYAAKAGTSRGDLMFLSGGPGGYGANYPEQGLAARYPKVSDQYRWVSMDVRGTGATGALDCPQLQRQVGSDDIAIPTTAAVQQCRELLGRSATLYSTAATVADLDDLRRALGDQTWSLDGISYGTYVGERYTLAHPKNVAKLVLDSVVPQTDVGPLDQVPLHAFARVFHSICAERHCPSDPVADLHTILANRTDGATLSDAILEAGIYDGYYAGVPEALDAAAHGSPAALNRLLADRALAAEATPATQLSQGAHASALCADVTWPWRSDDSPATRKAILLAAARRVPEAALYPYTAKDAAGNGYAVTCENWPTSPAPSVTAKLPRIPVLLLGGTHDLSTPIEWLQQEACYAPTHEIHIFADTGHSQQTYNGSPQAIAALTNFLLTK